jgi:hypothetical protein
MAGGSYRTFEFSAGGAAATSSFAWLSIENGKVRRQLDLRGAPGDPNERADIAAAAEAPDGTIVTWTGEAALHRFDSAGAYIGDLRLPEYREERRNARDMEERAETYRAVFKMEAPAEVLREQAAKPKPALVPGEPLKYDSRGRLWLLTSRGHDEFSYFEVFDGERHVGRARVRDRVLGFDVLDTTLVVLAERGTRDANGLRPLHLDWYRVPE